MSKKAPTDDDCKCNRSDQWPCRAWMNTGKCPSVSEMDRLRARLEKAEELLRVALGQLNGAAYWDPGSSNEDAWTLDTERARDAIAAFLAAQPVPGEPKP